MHMHPDPRSATRYVLAARAYIAAMGGQHVPCAICHMPVDTAQPSRINGRQNPNAPTIEHRYPVRRMRVEARTWIECKAWACDQSLWAVAHRRCQNKQGAHAVNILRSTPRIAKQSRAW